MERGHEMKGTARLYTLLTESKIKKGVINRYFG